MRLTEQLREIEIKVLKGALEQKKWQEVNTLLSKEHCITFFRSEMKYMHEVASIYIKSVEYGYENLSGAIESYFYSNKVPCFLIEIALNNEDPILFFQNVKQEALDIILQYTKFSCHAVDQPSQKLKEQPLILETLSKCTGFPSPKYLIKFIQDLKREINDGADSSATKEAIEILMKVNDWSDEQCKEIINNTKSLSTEEQESLCFVLNLSVSPTPIKSARNVAYEWQSSNDQISAGENDNNDNSSNNGLNQKQLLDQNDTVVAKNDIQCIEGVYVEISHSNPSKCAQPKVSLSPFSIDPLSILNHYINHIDIDWPVTDNTNSTLLLTGSGSQDLGNNSVESS